MYKGVIMASYSLSPPSSLMRIKFGEGGETNVLMGVPKVKLLICFNHLSKLG